MMNGMGGFGMGFGWIFSIIFLAAVIWAVVRLVISNQNRQDYPGNSSKNALDILKERYARGEISEAEFEKMKRQLKS